MNNRVQFCMVRIKIVGIIFKICIIMLHTEDDCGMKEQVSKTKYISLNIVDGIFVGMVQVLIKWVHDPYQIHKDTLCLARVENVKMTSLRSYL